MNPSPIADTLSIRADSLSVRADSLSVADTVAAESRMGIMLVDPHKKNLEEGSLRFEPEAEGGGSMSWVYMAAVVLFSITALKFKGNGRYVKAMTEDLTDTRERHNAFDETVRETSLVLLLNAVWSLSAGILLWQSIAGWGAMQADMGGGIGICTLAAVIYQTAMAIGYTIVGNVFSTRAATTNWVKGAYAASALEAFLLFPIALLALVQPDYTYAMTLTGGIVFVIGKMMFLYKGFRIFFTQISSWLLFLYYLCSLEIVPLILIYIAARSACSAWL